MDSLSPSGAVSPAPDRAAIAGVHQLCTEGRRLRLVGTAEGLKGAGEFPPQM